MVKCLDKGADERKEAVWKEISYRELGMRLHTKKCMEICKEEKRIV